MEYPSSGLLIVAKQGPLRDSMRALVTTLPRIEIIDETDDTSTALDVVSQHHPDLVLIDGNFQAEDIWVFLRQIRKRSPRTRRLMLADTVGEKQEIEAPGTEAIYLKGAPPGELVAHIERLLLPNLPTPNLPNPSPTPTSDLVTQERKDEDDSTLQALYG